MELENIQYGSLLHGDIKKWQEIKNYSSGLKGMIVLVPNEERKRKVEIVRQKVLEISQKLNISSFI